MARDCQAGAGARLKVRREREPINAGIGRARTVAGAAGRTPCCAGSNVRTRLVAVITLPLVLLLAVTVPEVLERRERAAEASQAAAITTAVDDVAAAADAIQGERTLSAALRAGAGPDVEPGAGRPARRRRPAVERAVAVARRPGRRARRRCSEPADGAAEQLGGLDQVRAETDTAVSEVPWNDPFAARARRRCSTCRRPPRRSPPTSAWARACPRSPSSARMKEAAASQARRWPPPRPGASCAATRTRILTDLRADEAAYRAAYLTTSPTDGARRAS